MVDEAPIKVEYSSPSMRVHVSAPALQCGCAAGYVHEADVLQDACEVVQGHGCGGTLKFPRDLGHAILCREGVLVPLPSLGWGEVVEDLVLA